MYSTQKNKKIIFYATVSVIIFIHSSFYYILININYPIPFVFFHLLGTLIIFSLIYKIKIASNDIPKIMENLAIMTEMDFCKKCQKYKPERTHHCSTCRKCIPRMDHHCMFLNKCIGADNIADFIRLSFFCTIMLIFMAISSGYSYYLLKEDGLDTSAKEKFKLSVVTSFIIANTLSGSFLFYFFSLHFRNILNNWTFLEKGVVDEMLNVGYGFTKNPFDMGVWANMNLLMGKWYFLYLYGEKREKMFFPKSYFISKWPPINIKDLWAL